jgi:hypothetical protein
VAVKKKGGRKGGRTVNVDMTGIEAGGKAVPDGVYTLEVIEVTEEEGQKAPYLNWKCRVSDGSAKGAPVWHITSLSPDALWNLKGLLEAMEVEVPDGALDLDLDEMAGNTFVATIANEEYQGKQRPKVVGYGGDLEGSTASRSSTRSEGKEETGRKSKSGFNKGDKVKFEDEGKAYTGKVVSIDGDMAKIEVAGKKPGDEEEWELSLDDLEAA